MVPSGISTIRGPWSPESQCGECWEIIQLHHFTMKDAKMDSWDQPHSHGPPTASCESFNNAGSRCLLSSASQAEASRDFLGPVLSHIWTQQSHTPAVLHFQEEQGCWGQARAAECNREIYVDVSQDCLHKHFFSNLGDKGFAAKHLLNN